MARRLNLPEKVKRDLKFLKPAGFENHMTIAELSRHVRKEVSWLRKLEADGRIPKARRVKRGKLQVRLWSPEQAEEIVEILSQHKPGRPASGS